MTEPKLDRRIERTRALLRDALFALINEKGYTGITIQEITDRANVNRVTFYFHYKDKEDLLFKVMEDLYTSLEANQPASTSAEDWMYQDALSAFQHVEHYAHLYKVLLSEKGSLSLIGRLIDYFVQSSQAKWHEMLPPQTEPPIPLEITEHFYAGAFVGIVRWWVLNDMPYTPEKMALMCNRLEINSGLWAWGIDSRDLTTN